MAELSFSLRYEFLLLIGLAAILSLQPDFIMAIKKEHTDGPCTSQKSASERNSSVCMHSFIEVFDNIEFELGAKSAF